MIFNLTRIYIYAACVKASSASNRLSLHGIATGSWSLIQYFDENVWVTLICVFYPINSSRARASWTREVSKRDGGWTVSCCFVRKCVSANGQNGNQLLLPATRFRSVSHALYVYASHPKNRTNQPKTI